MKEQIKAYAKKLHISDLGICEARIYSELDPILRKYDVPFTQPPEQRISPFAFVPDAKSILVCAFNYYSGDAPGTIAKYARGIDYHIVVKQKLETLCAWIESEYGGFSRYIFCDDSPLCDKYLAQQAGLGVFGRNHLLIHPIYGSYIVLGGIVTNLELEADTPLPGTCAQCGRCAAACPGGVFDGENGFDVTRCVSYLLQRKRKLQDGEKTAVQKAGMVWGCDVCSDVCPHNQTVPVTDIVEFQPQFYNLEEAALETDEVFRQNYKDAAFSWRGRKILQRNCAIQKK